MTPRADNVPAEPITGPPAAEPAPIRAEGPTEGPSAGPTAGPGRRPLVLVGVLASVAVVLVGAVVWYGVAVFGAWRAAHDRAEVVAAAERAAVDFTTFDYTTAKADLDRLQGATTADFVRGFNDDSGAFLRSLGADKVKVVGTAASTGLADYTPTQAHVLVAIRAQFSSAQQPDQQERDYRMELTMVYRDGRWLADSAGFVA
jgi:Mce-associated membrane protein